MKTGLLHFASSSCFKLMMPLGCADPGFCVTKRHIYPGNWSDWKSSLNINECMDTFVAVLAYRHTDSSFPDAKKCSPSWSLVVFFSAPEALISKDKAQTVEKEQDKPLCPALTLPVKEETINPPLPLRGSWVLGGPCPRGSLAWPKDRQPWPCHVSSSIHTAPLSLQEACVARGWQENDLE